MKKDFQHISLSAGLADRIGFFHLAGFLITLPFDRFYSQLILISFILHTIFHFRANRLRQLPILQIMMLSSIFLLNVVGMAWSADIPETVKDLQRQLAIIIFPLLLSLNSHSIAANRKRLLLLFAATCALTILYLFADALRIIHYSGLPIRSLFSAYFINHNFSEPIGMHATYFSMYVSLSLVTCLSYGVDEKDKRYRRLYIIAILILIAGLIQLASRAVLLGTLAYCIAGLFFLPVRSARKLKYAILITGGAVIIILLITGIEGFQKRFILELKTDLTENPTEPGHREPRIDRWRCAYELILESPFLGHGSGSEKRLLKEKYFESKLYTSYLRELNAHNQYLSAWLKWGIAGLIIFLFTIGMGFRLALQRGDMVLLGFMVLIAVVSFSENILDVNKGIFFYGFFFSFFWFAGKPFALFQRSGKTKEP